MLAEHLTTRRATSTVWRIFAELNNPKRALSKVNITSIDRGKHVLALFLN